MDIDPCAVRFYTGGEIGPAIRPPDVWVMLATPEAVTARVARHFSLSPFGARSVRMCVLFDPSPRTPTAVQRGVLRAMQEACAHRETGSLTNLVQAAVNAAHYVLQHHNNDVLPIDHATAAAAAIATRGGRAYVALAGDAAAFTLRDARLSGQRSGARQARPLGLEHDPRIVLWSTPLGPNDRLVIACGATWPADAGAVIADILSDGAPATVEERLAEALGARVVVVHGTAAAEHVPPRASVPRVGMSWRRWLMPLLPLAAICFGALAALGPPGDQQHVALAQQAELLLTQAQQARDVYQAHALAASAHDFAARAANLAPTQHTPLVSTAARTLEEIDRVYPVQPQQAVRFGPAGVNVVDLAVGANALYTLDVVEAAVRRFLTDGLDQLPTPETLLARHGTPVGRGQLDAPVAMQFVPGPTGGALTILDRSRTVVQVGADGALHARALPSAGYWQRLGALGAGADGSLLVLDSGARQLLEYPAASERLVDPPRVVVGPESATELLATRDVFVRLDDGRVRRFSRDGQPLSFAVRPPDGAAVLTAGMAPDRVGGLYLADPAHARILHTAADGDFVRQLRHPALTGVRQLQASLDGARLYALVPSGVLTIELPPDVPAPVPGADPDTVQEPTQLPK